MGDVSDLIGAVRSGVARLTFCDPSGAVVSSGSGFLIRQGLVTNDHVAAKARWATLHVGFDDGRPPVRFERGHVEERVIARSPEVRSGLAGPRRDYYCSAIEHDSWMDRHRFPLSRNPSLRVGDGVLYLGFPFGSDHLTAHRGGVSALYYDADSGADVFQIDGSVNPGNSGGPMLNPTTREVEGIVTAAETGLMLKPFEELLIVLEKNVTFLTDYKGGGIQFQELDVIRKANLSSQRALLQLALALRRSANVGIGFANRSDYLRNVLDSASQ